METTCRSCLSAILVFVSIGCGTHVPTGPEPAGGYNHTQVKYENRAANLATTEIPVEDTTIVADGSPISAKTVKCKSNDLLRFQGKLIALTEADAPQFIAVECTRTTALGSIITSTGSFICKLEDGTINYSVELPSPQSAGNHKLTIKAVRVVKSDGSLVGEGGETTTILAEGIVEVSSDFISAPEIAPDPDPDPDPAFSRDRTGR